MQGLTYQTELDETLNALLSSETVNYFRKETCCQTEQLLTILWSYCNQFAHEWTKAVECLRAFLCAVYL